ncbi:MAG: hypothetical protein WEB52_06605 [Dehalococcoidia bacterium]
MTIALKLTHDEPKLVFLALVYHLGRPGSELDPATKQPLEHGLREVKLALGNQLLQDAAVIEVDDYQVERLLSAIYGSVNELRLYHMRSGAESTVGRFTETARDIFPEIAPEPEAALEVAESMMMLHRRIERALRPSPERAPDSLPAADTKRRGLWPFRR